MEKFYNGFWPVLTAVALVGAWKIAGAFTAELGDALAWAAIVAVGWTVGTGIALYIILKRWPSKLSEDCAETTLTATFLAACAVASLAVATSAPPLVAVAAGLVLVIAICYIGGSVTQGLKQPNEPWFWRSMLLPAGLVAAWYTGRYTQDTLSAVAVLALFLFVQFIRATWNWPMWNDAGKALSNTDSVNG